MKDLKGTKTEKNLHDAFAGESMARNKYTYYASKARKEGYEQIAALFEETAGNEKEHATITYALRSRLSNKGVVDRLLRFTGLIVFEVSYYRSASGTSKAPLTSCNSNALDGP